MSYVIKWRDREKKGEWEYIPHQHEKYGQVVAYFRFFQNEHPHHEHEIVELGSQ